MHIVALNMYLERNRETKYISCVAQSWRYPLTCFSWSKYSNNDVFQTSRQTRSSTNLVTRICSLLLLHSTSRTWRFPYIAYIHFVWGYISACLKYTFVIEHNCMYPLDYNNRAITDIITKIKITSVLLAGKTPFMIEHE